MSSTVSHYQLSQKFNPLLTIIFTIIGIFVAIVLGIIYSIISYYSPFVIIDIGLVVVMGLTLAYLASFLAKAAKVRNTMVNFFMAFFICLFAYYSSVCGFEVGLFSGDFTDYIELFFSPFTVVDIMFDEILPYREIPITRKSNTSHISGLMLGVVYLIELLVFFYPLIVSFHIDDYYCEDCQAWYKKYQFFSLSNESLETKLSANLTGSYADALSQTTFYTDTKGIVNQVDQSAGNIDVLEYQYCQCPKCRQKSILTIEKKLLKKDKKEYELKGVSDGFIVQDAYIDNKTDALFEKEI